MDVNAVKRWISDQFRYAPWTSSIIAINLTIWLLHFFGIQEPALFVGGELGLQAAWRWLTYPLYSPLPFLWLAVMLYVFHWIGNSLERQWGSTKFIRVFVVTTLLSAGATWLGYAALAKGMPPSVSLAGLMYPQLAFFVIWAAINSEATVLAFFIIPIKASYLAIGAIVLTYFSTGDPVLGLFLVAVPIAGWFWGKRTPIGAAPSSSPKRSVMDRFRSWKRERKKSKFKLIEGQSMVTSSIGTGVPSLRELNRPIKETPIQSADEIELDRILDKIRFEGMAALTTEERQTLDNQSKKLKGES